MKPAVRLPEYMTQDFSQLSLRVLWCPCCLLVDPSFLKLFYSVNAKACACTYDFASLK